MDSPFYRLKRGATRPPPDRVGAASPFRTRSRASASAPCAGMARRGDARSRSRRATGLRALISAQIFFAPPAAATALKSSDRGRAVEDFAGDLDLDVDEVLPHAGGIDVDAEARRLGRPNLTVAVAFKLVSGEGLRQRLWRRRVLAQPVLGETRVGLQRGRQGKVRGEGVIDEGHTPLAGVVGNPLGGSNATDPAAIDLDEPHIPVVDQMAGHVRVVRPLASRKPDGAR